MSITWSSKYGYHPSNSISNAVSDLTRFYGWKRIEIVDVPVEASRAAFDWLIEQHGHNEYNTSYGPTCDSEWFGPFTSYAKPSHYSYVLKDKQAATLFKVFHG